MRADLTRRKLLRRIGGGGLIVGTASQVPGLAAATRGEGGGDLPSENVEYTTVIPYDCRKWPWCNEQPQEVPVGEWIRHAWTWYPAARDGDGGVCAGEERQKEVLDNHLENTEWEILIDGDPLDNPKQYWSKRYVEDFEQWVLVWEYYTPPKAVGSTHTITRKKEVLDRHQVGWQSDSCESRYREPGESKVPTTGTYEVVRR